ncbi:MAG: hypothetical protein IJ781_10295 [Atopobiaceae bacterium]|nr:hypothetical protein [Atopobiaceae bacterium]
MELQPYILGWAIPTILSAIVGYLAGKLRAVRSEREERERQAEKVQDTLDALTIMVCRLSIYDEHFTVDEKVDAYKLYRSKGGNHQTKKHMDELLGEDADAWLARHE